MEIKELRIGNYVHIPDTNQDVPISAISIFANSICVNLNMLEPLQLEQIEPIPLTKSILLKCGFIELPAWNELILNGFRAEFRNNKIIWFYPDIEIVYLHKLQNVYFALKGEELEVKI